MSWTVDIVTQDGTKVVEAVDGAKVGPIRWVLNRPTTCTVELPILSSSLTPDAIVSEDGDTLNEIQVFRDGALVGWFVPIGIDEDPQLIRLTCADPLWLLSRRFVGELYDTNLLDNPSFNDDTSAPPSGWSNNGVDTIETAFSYNAMDPPNVVALECSTASVNKYLYQDFTIPQSTEQTVWMVSAYVWVDPLTPFVATDYEHGVVIARYNASNVIQDAWWARVNDSTDKLYWTRLSAPLKVPPTDGTQYLRVWLGTAEGKIFYDAVRLVEVKRLAYQGQDQAVIAQGLVEHAQDTSIQKADLDIGTDCPGTGIFLNRLYPYAEHEQILQALIDLAEGADGFDFSMVVTETTKTFTTHYPQKGSASSVATFEWGVNIADWSRSTSIDQAVGSGAMLGPGTTDVDGRADDREHHWTADPLSHSGRRLEAVEMAPSRANLIELEDLAEELVDARKVPSVLELTVHRTDTDDWAQRIVDGTLEVGDVVTVVIDHGTVEVNATYRIVELVLDPETETITPVIEPARTFDS